MLARHVSRYCAVVCRSVPVLPFLQGSGSLMPPCYAAISAQHILFPSFRHRCVGAGSSLHQSPWPKSLRPVDMTGCVGQQHRLRLPSNRTCYKLQEDRTAKRRQEATGRDAPSVPNDALTSDSHHSIQLVPFRVCRLAACSSTMDASLTPRPLHASRLFCSPPIDFHEYRINFQQGVRIKGTKPVGDWT